MYESAFVVIAYATNEGVARGRFLTPADVSMFRGTTGFR